jgi:ATP-dependent 26S proteasome regulatory subunit
VREQARRSNIYRGKIISLERQMGHREQQSFKVRFHRFPPVRREEIILPDETVNLLERNTVRFFQHADVLRRSGRSVKRGLLLHGKPGTGKTYTAKWLAQSLEGVTTLLLSGEQLWLIKECCQMARMLAPSLVIMEDVDLIATERDEQRHPAYQITLHQLLNEMDGLASDAEVIFLLTTNRPQVIEPALAGRPGRIDQALEFPLPDADCRHRLFQLYGHGLVLDLSDPDRLIAKTEGASPAFIQELVRKAALIAAEENSTADGTLRLTDAHLEAALRELVLGGGELTRNLLGFAAEAGPA